MGKFTPLANSIGEALELFCYSSLRKGQDEPIQSVLSGQDTLVVMPTGAGKSLCFQIPACLQEGLTIVVSPLIALMKDQVDALQRKNISATFINSSLSPDEQNQRIRAMQSGAFRIVYVAPERFRSTRFTYALDAIPIRLLAIDEAHCISEWGHDFRPDYRKLKQIRVDLGSPPTIALTATATPDVQKDIIDALGLDDPAIHVSGFTRKNLFFEVAQIRSKKEKFLRILALLEYYKKGSFIIYCATRKQCDEVLKELKSKGVNAGIYHGGLSDNERRKAQDDWLADRLPVLVATNAFGMGVDKSNVRGVIHYNIPGSVESYYQEAGRAGRDGEESHCLLLFSLADRGIHDFFIENTYPAREVFEKVWSYLQDLQSGSYEVKLSLLAREFSTSKAKLHPMGLEAILRIFQKKGSIEYLRQGGFESISVYDVDGPLPVDWHDLSRRRKVAQDQVKDLLSFCGTRECRQAFIVRYFGESEVEDCQKCDICLGVPEYAQRVMQENIRRIRSGSDDGLTVLRKVLAGIARAKGRRGGHALAGMLVGSNAKALKQTGLQHLSTFGILRQMKKEDALYLLDLCVNVGWARRNDYGCLLISTAGSAVMRQEETPNADVLSMLNLIFSASTSRQKSTASAARSRSKNNGDCATGTRQTYSQTLRLHQEGMGYKAIAKHRELTVQTVLRHFQKLTLAGEQIDVSADIDEELLEKVRLVAADWNLGDREKPLIEALDGACTYNCLRLHLIPILRER